MTQPFTTLSVHHAFGYTWTNLLLMEQVIFVSDGTTNTIIPNVKVEMGIKKNNLRVRYFFIVEDFPALVSVGGIVHCLSQVFNFYFQNVKGSRIKKMKKRMLIIIIG
jgi:hypothetical protein